MRVLIVTQYFWPEDFRINDLAQGLIEKGHEVVVLTGIPNYPSGRFYKHYNIWNKPEIYNDIQIYRVPLIPRGAGRGINLFMNYISFAFFASVLGPIFCRGRFDSIFVFEPSPITVAIPAIIINILKRTKLILWVLDLWPESLSSAGRIKSNKIIKCVDTLVKIIYKNCNTILYSSKGFKSSIESKISTNIEIDYFPNWIEPNKSINDFTMPELPNGYKILFAGNIGYSQDFETIINAAKTTSTVNTNIHWIILGDGRKFNWVKQEIDNNNLTNTVHLLGRFPQETMPYFFNAVDALLVTLRSDPTFSLTLPGKIPSYMSCGKPILAAIDGEGRELINSLGIGSAVPAGDAKQLSEAALAMQSIPDETRQSMSMIAKKYCDNNFNRDKLITQLCGWMERKSLTHPAAGKDTQL